MEILEFINYEKDKSTKLTNKLICRFQIGKKEFICSIDIKKNLKCDKNIYIKELKILLYANLIMKRELDLKRNLFSDYLKEIKEY